MATANFVKKAQKDNDAVKKGESYWWWSFRFGGKHFSKERPKPSQLTQSAYTSTALSIQEDAEQTPDFDDIEDAIENLKSSIDDLMNETQGSFDNMPEGLQQGDTGQLLEERVQACESAISELESVDIELNLDDKPDDQEEDEYKTERAEAIWQEVQEALNQLDL